MVTVIDKNIRMNWKNLRMKACISVLVSTNGLRIKTVVTSRYDELNLDPVLNFGRMNKKTIMSMVASLFRLPENITSESEVEIEVAEGITTVSTKIT